MLAWSIIIIQKWWKNINEQTTWLGSPHMDDTMKVLHKTKLQHQGYEFY
jgi:hypothetical protein